MLIIIPESQQQHLLHNTTHKDEVAACRIGSSGRGQAAAPVSFCRRTGCGGVHGGAQSVVRQNFAAKTARRAQAPRKGAAPRPLRVRKGVCLTHLRVTPLTHSLIHSPHIHTALVFSLSPTVFSYFVVPPTKHRRAHTFSNTTLPTTDTQRPRLCYHRQRHVWPLLGCCAEQDGLQRCCSRTGKRTQSRTEKRRTVLS